MGGDSRVITEESLDRFLALIETSAFSKRLN